MAFISIYKNNPTTGSTDGTVVSQNGTQSAPISASLNSTENESKIITLAIRADSGYTTDGDTTFSFSGTNANKWSICETADGVFSDTLIITSTIGSTNKLFYVKADSDSSESPSNDTSVSLIVSGKLIAA